MNVVEIIQSLLSAANDTTGADDENLTEAVQSLIAGYGGGASDVDIQIVVPETDITNANYYSISHNLGNIPSWMFMVGYPRGDGSNHMIMSSAVFDDNGTMLVGSGIRVSDTGSFTNTSANAGTFVAYDDAVEVKAVGSAFKWTAGNSITVIVGYKD